MDLCLLHFDDSLRHQRDFIAVCEQRNARQIDLTDIGKRVRLWSSHAELTALDRVLREAFFTGGRQNPRLFFLGSGDFHHVTALLLAVTLETCEQPVTVIHFDNHPDSVDFRNGLHCGSWINRVACESKVRHIITLGVCSRDLRNLRGKGANFSLIAQNRLALFPYNHPPSRVSGNFGSGTCFTQVGNRIHWQTIADIGETKFIEKLLACITTEDVYITVDKDVLAREDCETNWDQGVMRMAYLLTLLDAIGAGHRIIGADVTGDYSRPHYAGNLWARFIKRAEIYLDQPKHKVCEEAVAAQNGRINLALLEHFSGMMA